MVARLQVMQRQNSSKPGNTEARIIKLDSRLYFFLGKKKNIVKKVISGRGIATWEAPEVLMFCFLTWMMFLL